MRKRKSEKSWMGPLPAVPACNCQICAPEATYDPMDRQVIDTVVEHGWQVMLVAEDCDCAHPDHDGSEVDLHDPQPAFAYTIGLGHRVGHPELFISGLDHGLMHRALNNVAERVMSGRRLAPGDVLEDVLGRVPVVVEEIAESALADTVPWSGWFHRRKPEGLALVWPTTSGLFAWQPGAPVALLDEAQPPAWRVPFEHGGGVGIDPPWPFPVPPDFSAFTCTHVTEQGAPVLWVARQSSPGGSEDWTLHCGGSGHADHEIAAAHIAHLVRSAPSVRALSALALDHEAERPDTDSPWEVRPLA